VSSPHVVVEPGTTSRRAGLVSWILLAGLGIIWAAFLLPSRRRSPASSVEEFERKMTMLAEANKNSGRWVLMPRRGQRFMGPTDRSRARARRRRRQVFALLLEACGLTFLMGLFPPFRPLFAVTAVLAGLLVVYTLLLIRLRTVEMHQARARRTPAARSGMARDPRRRVSANGNGHGSGNGYSPIEAGVRVIDGDVHVVVRTSEELEREAILASASR